MTREEWETYINDLVQRIEDIKAELDNARMDLSFAILTRPPTSADD